MNNKLVLLLLVSLVLCIGSIIYQQYSEPTMSREDALTWIEKGQAQQFCGLIYPQVEDCVTFKVSECPAIVNTQVQPCIQTIKADMGSKVTNSKSKDYFKQVGLCLEKNMHAVIIENYLVDSESCRSIMS